MPERLAGLPNLRGTSLKGSVRLAKKMARSASLSRWIDSSMNCTYLDADAEDLRFTRPICGEDIRDSIRRSSIAAAFAQVQHADFLNQMLYLDTKIFMTSLNLTYNDKMSMASSVEVRVPFLDRELAEFVAWNVPPKSEAEGILPADHEIHFPQGDERYSSRAKCCGSRRRDLPRRSTTGWPTI